MSLWSDPSDHWPLSIFETVSHITIYRTEWARFNFVVTLYYNSERSYLQKKNDFDF